MKKAVILVGSHHVGKSDTIRNHLKPLLKQANGKPLGRHHHIFELGGKKGYILSQSLEEGGRDVDATVRSLADYQYLVFAARPVNEPESEVNALQLSLQTAGFAVSIIVIMDKFDDRAQKAAQIFRILNSH
jgi:hypothetical protein